MNGFLEKLRERCVDARIFLKEAFDKDYQDYQEGMFDVVRRPGWYVIDWYEAADFYDNVYKIIGIIEYAGPCGLSAKFISRDKVKRITKDVFQFKTVCPSYLVRVYLPEEELTLAYLSLEN